MAKTQLHTTAIAILCVIVVEEEEGRGKISDDRVLNILFDGYQFRLTEIV